MYSVFEKLCKEKGVTPSAVAIACGFAPSVVSRWKSGESNPKADKLKKIADYFGVSVTYLMIGEDARMTIDGDMAEMLQMIENGKNRADFLVPLNDDLKIIVEVMSHWNPKQIAKMRKKVEELDEYIGEAQ